jgi:diguanylate cyclase (GGDEF)-like protein
MRPEHLQTLPKAASPGTSRLAMEECMNLVRWTGVSRRSLAPRTWAVREEPRWLAVFITVVLLLYVAAVGRAARSIAEQPGDIGLFLLLLACSATTVEMTRRAGENAGLIKDVYGVWELPVAILLPPLYALIAPIPRIVLSQWRIRRLPIYRRVFTAAAIGLSYGCASWVFHSLFRLGITPDPMTASSGAQTAKVILAVATCGVLQWAVNSCLVLPAVKGSDPTESVRGMLFGRERLHNDITELCVAVLVTMGITISPLTVAFALPFVTLLQRSIRHAQLVNDSRIDGKTGLLNAGTWEREASAELTRALRTQSDLAVAFIDIDNFKTVNDTHGHLAGDRALIAVANTIKIFLREYDLVGRFGGEEFAVLLPQTGGLDARRIAERMRAQVAEVPIEVGDKSRAETISLTVSVGLSTLEDSTSQLTDLLAAADVALYRAKNSGRNQVRMSGDADPGHAPACTSPGAPLPDHQRDAADR